MSSISGVSSSGLNFTGLATGIDTEKIISGMTAINERRIATFRSKQAEQSSRQATMTGLRSKLGEFQGQVSKLSRSIGGAFETRKLTSNDETIMTGTATSTALPGNYTLKVEQLAQAQQVASTALADSSTNIKTGSIDIRVGASAVKTINIDSTNNTLQGLATQINNANIDVRASLVNDGSGFRLLLNSNRTGATNTIQITNNLTGGSGESVNLTDRVVQAATDSRVVLGSGPGAVTVTNPTNRIDNLLSGVTIDLKKADSSKTINLSISNDNDGAKKAIEDLVKSYNDVLEFIDDRDNFDSQTNRAGVFLGNKDVSDLRNDLATVLTSIVPGTTSSINRLSAIGLSLNEKSRLQFDSSKFDKLVNGEVAGASFDDLKKLFALSGTSSNSGVSFLLGGDKTKPSPTGAPYKVDVSQAATRASITGSTVLGTSVTITGTNNSFSVKVNNLASALVSIDAGTYSPSQLAAAIQSQINSRYVNSQVAVDLDAGALRIGSISFGSSSKVEIESGNALATLGLTANSSNTGRNVVGAFKVGDVYEPATGAGQVLSGNSDNKNTAGLQVRVGLTDTQITSSPEADLTVSQGIGARLASTLTKYLDPVNGRFKSIDDRFKQNIEQIDKTLKRESTMLETRKNQLLSRFASMESSVNRLKGVGNQIASTFGVIPLG